MVVIMEDFNGKVGRQQNDTEQGNVGNCGLGERNNRGDLLVDITRK